MFSWAGVDKIRVSKAAESIHLKTSDWNVVNLHEIPTVIHSGTT